ncbi:hypothetical protein EYF80_012781 [Liparis tanakae]|uniref:Uncharacterized protein n=1 Tax=Liparis tanakae TaxID=230148 RepID=A0A4Z2IGW7_9TELE|nr:hypothetical protein EYF80_012781 [Liparis tanakae]
MFPVRDNTRHCTAARAGSRAHTAHLLRSGGADTFTEVDLPAQGLPLPLQFAPQHGNAQLHALSLLLLLGARQREKPEKEDEGKIFTWRRKRSVSDRTLDHEDSRMETLSFQEAIVTTAPLLLETSGISRALRSGCLGNVGPKQRPAAGDARGLGAPKQRPSGL